MTLIIFLILILGIFVSIASPLFIKFYSNTNSLIWIILALMAYAMMTFIFAILFKKKDVTIVYTVIKISTVAVLFLLDILLFHGKITIKNTIGIFLAIIAVILLS